MTADRESMVRVLANATNKGMEQAVLDNPGLHRLRSVRRISHPQILALGVRVGFPGWHGALTTRLIMLSIDVWDQQYPIDVCFRPLPFLAPHYFTKSIRIVRLSSEIEHAC